MRRVLICYSHVSPHQVPALRCAAERLAGAGFELIVLEQYGRSRLHGWTRNDAPRPDGWICVCPDESDPGPIRMACAISQIVRRSQVSLTIVNGWADPVSWYLAAAKSWLGARIAVVADSTELDHRRSAVKEAGKRFFLKAVDGVFAAGTRQLRYLETLGMDPSRVAFGCDVVENARFIVECRVARDPSEPIVIGTAARLEPVKNLEAALEGLHVLERGGGSPPVLWRIVGRGPLKASLEQKARSLGVDLQLEGFVPYEQMPAFYAALDLYWQPSVSEPWGLAINEAMASGLPIVASDRCGCADDLISPANGWIHDVTPNSMASTLARALTDRSRWPAMREASRRRIAAWDLDRFADGLLRVSQIAFGEVPVPEMASPLVTDLPFR